MTTYTGKAKYARVYEHNRDTKYDESGVYSVEIYLEGTELARAKKDGIPLHHNESGSFFKAKRKHQIMKDGAPVVLGPPSVVGPDGKTPFTENIGNDSIVCAMGKLNEWKGTRSFKLSALQVIEHVPYEGNNNSFKDHSTVSDNGDEKVA